MKKQIMILVAMFAIWIIAPARAVEPNPAGYTAYYAGYNKVSAQEAYNEAYEAEIAAGATESDAVENARKAAFNYADGFSKTIQGNVLLGSDEYEGIREAVEKAFEEAKAEYEAVAK